MRRTSVIAVWVVLLTISAPALAQSPLPSGDAVSLDVPRTEQVFSTEDPASFTITVTYNAQGSGTPIDQGGAADVTITITDVPDGWTVKADPSAFALAPGADRDVTVTVTSAPSGAKTGSLTITAEAVSQDPSNTFLPSGSDSATVDMVREESATRTAVEALGGWIWFIIGAAVATVFVLAYLLADSRRRVVRLSTDVDEAIIQPGAKVDIPFRVMAQGHAPDRVAIHADVAAKGWSAAIPVTDVELVPGDEEELTVTVTAPARVAKGSRQVVRIVAVPESSPEHTGVLQVAVKVEK